MKRIAVFLFIFMFIGGTAYAQSNSRTFYTSIAPVSSTYTSKAQNGIIAWERSDVPKTNTVMGFSGTSPCQVIDLKDPGLGGYFTFQFSSLTGATSMASVSPFFLGVSCPPVTGTTISVHWRGSNVDSPVAWSTATKNTVINGTNAYTGTTSIGFDINTVNSPGVTPFRYFRMEFESGLSKESNGNGGLAPTGILFVR